jgi:CheY-like chemotaxis protein
LLPPAETAFDKDHFQIIGVIKVMRIILVAEDSEDDVFFLKRALARTGVEAEVRVVRDGEEALAYLRGQRQYSDRHQFPFPHLALLDVKMPRKTGLEVLAEVRDDPRLKRLPVIFLSSSDLPKDIDRAFDLHANSYLLKRGNPDLLVSLMQKVEEYWLYLNQCPTCPAS